MGADISWIGESRKPHDPRPKTLCKFCLRSLRVIVHDPTEIEPHCTARGCVWCAECYAGKTPCSPVFTLVQTGQLIR